MYPKLEFAWKKTPSLPLPVLTSSVNSIRDGDGRFYVPRQTKTLLRIATVYIEILTLYRDPRCDIGRRILILKRSQFALKRNQYRFFRRRLRPHWKSASDEVFPYCLAKI